MIVKNLSLFLLPLILYLSQGAYARFYEEHAEGWHWYKNILDENKDEKQESKDPIVQMKVLRATIERALDMAILYPTDSNVRNYIALQNRLSNQASIFAGMWQKVLLENPSYDYSLVHPTNALARRVDLDKEHLLEEEAIAKLAKEGGLFFFYSGSCVYCQKFAPMLKNFSTKYKISIVPITMDGKSLPEFPNSKMDRGQAARFNITVEPSLYVVNPYTGKAYPICHGVISEYDLRKRILDISQNFVGGT